MTIPAEPPAERTSDNNYANAASPVLWRRWLCATLLGITWLVAASILALPWLRWIETDRDTGVVLQAHTLRPWDEPSFVVLLCLPLLLLLWALLPFARRSPPVSVLGRILGASGGGLVCLLLISVRVVYAISAWPGPTSVRRVMCT